MKLELRDYQTNAIDGLYQYWADGRGENPLIVAPTGSGKSLILAKLIEDAMSFPGTRVLVLTHVKELLLQDAQELVQNYPEADFGFYSASIGQKRLDKPITFAGIQSVWQRAYDFVPAPDLVLIDEAHLVPKNTTTRYGKFLADLKVCNPDVKIVGLTATPYRLDSGYLHKGDGALFDGIAFDIPVGMLMDRGHLCQVISKGSAHKIDLTNVHMRGGEFIESEIAVAASDPELVRATVAEIVEYGAERKAWLVFASGVAHAEMLRAEFDGHGIPCGVITGDTDGRDKIIADFKAQRLRCLIGVNVLTTGFNVPAVDLVAIVRATASTGLYVQIVGRGTRTAPGKSDCLARGTLVLTDRGEVKIEDVTLDDKVWDGVSFVAHCGSICKGVQKVITWDGITGTPDHRVMTNDGWMQLSEAKRRKRRIVRTGMGRVPIRFTNGEVKKSGWKIQPSESRGGVHELRPHLYEQFQQHETTPEHKSVPELQWEAACCCANVALPKMPSATGQMQKPKKQPFCEIWRSRDRIQVCGPEQCCDMDITEHWGSGQKQGVGPDRQRWALRAGELEVGSSCQEYEKQHTLEGQQGEVHSIQGEPSRGKIRRRNFDETHIRNDARGNSGEMGETIPQTKREVWDILNAGPLQRFTANGRLVHNCLILDYGQNVERHGFIDAVKPKDKMKGGDGVAPAKECPDCQEMLHTAVRLCPKCGHEFPAPELNHATKAYGGAILSTQVQAEWVDVDRVSYSRWKKEGKPDSIRVTYECGMISHSEWLCPDHGGYAASRYNARKPALGAMADTTDDAIEESRHWAKPGRIKIRPQRDSKFFEIVQLDYSEREVELSLEDDDIPF
jgi:superfamily II DNA or RNA helicase